MKKIKVLNSSKAAVISYHQWRLDAHVLARLGLVCLTAVVMGLSAQLRIPLPFTPVPLTGQVLVVLLSGIMIGAAGAGLSMVLYAAMGFAGMPWFAGWSAGAWFNPTTGYLIGFIPAAVFTGRFFPHARGFIAQMLVMTAAIGIIYLFGALHLALILKTGFSRTLTLAVLPFFPVDLLKAAAAAALGRFLMPGTASRVRS